MWNGWSCWIVGTSSKMPTGAPTRARSLDERYEQSLLSFALPSVNDLVAHVRTYLRRQDAEIGHRNTIARILKVVPSYEVTSISLGPTIDKGPTDSHFHLESGSRLSFGVQVREGNGRCSLIAYRFQLNLPETFAPAFYRFDLNQKVHDSPLTEPRCHYHAGLDDVRLPCPVLSPLDVLDRIFLVIEPNVLRSLNG